MFSLSKQRQCFKYGGMPHYTMQWRGHETENELIGRQCHLSFLLLPSFFGPLPPFLPLSASISIILPDVISMEIFISIFGKVTFTRETQSPQRWKRQGMSSKESFEILRQRWSVWLGWCGGAERRQWDAGKWWKTSKEPRWRRCA